jgi:hypothetical protein
MPDAAVQDVDAEGAPQGRSAPGSGKIFGFPWWVWAIAAGGTFAVVWYLRNQSGSTGTTAASTLGAAGTAGTDPLTGLPVSQTDPLTAVSLLQAMQDLATRLGATSNSPSPATAPSNPGVTPTGPAVPSQAGAVSSAHSSGGSSTALTNVQGIPSIAPPTAVVQAAMTTATTIRAAIDANIVAPTPKVSTSIVPAPKPTSVMQVIQRIISGPVAPTKVTVVAPVSFNPIHARSSGTQAIA